MTFIPPEMLVATKLTRAGRVGEATALIQKFLSGQPDKGSKKSEAALIPPTLDLVAEDVMAKPAEPVARSHDVKKHRTGARPGTRVYDHLSKIRPFQSPRLWHPSDLAPSQGTFLIKTFRNGAGEREYKLYIPSREGGEPRPLILMLHGCTQSADDFAAGTRMNFAAEYRDCYVAYPEQTKSANPSKCWNWFDKAHQMQGHGEPAIIAGLIDQICRDHSIDPRRVYIAGLSAGGAAAAVMGQAYPDLFAAVGVHSGLPCGIAQDLPSAFAAMKGGYVPTMPSHTIMPTIVFHGDRDTTVHPKNGAAIASRAVAKNCYEKAVEQGCVENGRRYSRHVHRDERRKIVVEEWIIHDGGHAWSGGSNKGSFTDPLGPDATGEMLRFFLDHARPD